MTGNQLMGRVTCQATIENAVDAALVRSGREPKGSIRQVTVNDALVDTGASTLGLPKKILMQLGFDQPTSSRPARNTTGAYVVNLFGPVRLKIFDRDITLDAMEVDDSCPVLIGQIPLEHMQLIVNMAEHRVDKSPENGGEWILDAY